MTLGKKSAMASLTPMSEGYGAAMFDLSSSYRYIEIQVTPKVMKIYLRSQFQGIYYLASWAGEEALIIGAAVVNGHMPPAILADWCDENETVTCHYGFTPSKWLRIAV
jgi:hypothetical protein